MRLVMILMAGAALTCAGEYIAAPVSHALAHLAVSDDPVLRADLLVKDALGPQRLFDELEAALKTEDDELAESLIDLAHDNHVTVDERQIKSLSDLKAHSGSRSLRDFADGFVSGGRDSGAALSGAVTADVTGFGDVRDLVLEGRKIWNGAAADHLTIGLAAAGLALSVATWTSVGAALPARSGVSLLKAVQKSGRLSKPLAATLARSASASLDQDALKLAIAAAGRLDLTAARQAAGQVLRPTARAEFERVGESVATVYARAGQRGTREALAIARSPVELQRAAVIASAKGTRTRGIFALLGRGALMLGGLSFTLVGWLMTLVAWLFGAAMLARKFGLMLGRMIWPPRQRKQSPQKQRVGVTPILVPERARLAPARR